MPIAEQLMKHVLAFMVNYAIYYLGAVDQGAKIIGMGHARRVSGTVRCNYILETQFLRKNI